MKLSYSFYSMTLDSIQRMTVISGEEMSLTRVVSSLSTGYESIDPLIKIRGQVEFCDRAIGFDCYISDLGSVFRTAIHQVKG